MSNANNTISKKKYCVINEDILIYSIKKGYLSHDFTYIHKYPFSRKTKHVQCV